MSDSEQDDEFEAYLKRRTPIDKRMSSLDQLEPPPELDRIVIGKARKAIHGGSPFNLYHAPKWALPVGLAATILISFAVLLDLGVRAKRNDASLQAAHTQTSATGHSQSPLRPEPTLVSQGPGGRPAEGDSAAKAGGPVGESEARPGAPPGVSSASRAAASATAASASSDAAPAASAEVEFASEHARTRLARAEKAAKRARPEPEATAETMLEEAVAVGPPRAAAYASMTPGSAPVAPGGAQSATAPPEMVSTAPRAVAPDAKSQSSGSSESAREATVDEAQSMGRNVPVPAPPPIPPPPLGGSATEAPGATPVPAAAPRQSGSNSAKPGHPDAATWLKRIEKLRADGHTADAEREMRRFRQTYPDYPVPTADQ
jgi:hypothetical protein